MALKIPTRVLSPEEIEAASRELQELCSRVGNPAASVEDRMDALEILASLPVEMRPRMHPVIVLFLPQVVASIDGPRAEVSGSCGMEMGAAMEAAIPRVRLRATCTFSYPDGVSP